MVIAIPAGISTRARLRDHLRDTLSALITDATKVVPSGEWDGVPVVTVKDLADAMSATFGADLPALDEKVAEIATPGTVYVAAKCPLCGIPQNVTVEIDAALSVDTSGRELKATHKSKARTHICGQQPLPEAAEGQLGLDETVTVPGAPFGGLIQAGESLDDAWARVGSDVEIVATEAGQELLDAVNAGRGAEVPIPAEPRLIGDPVPCPYPGCTLDADHAGDHESEADQGGEG